MNQNQNPVSIGETDTDIALLIVGIVHVRESKQERIVKDRFALVKSHAMLS
jgi:hypothetical protein